MTVRYNVLLPTAFEKNLQPEWQGRFFTTWASFDTLAEAEGWATKLGGKVEAALRPGRSCSCECGACTLPGSKQSFERDGYVHSKGRCTTA
jgi:hypothetical protein